MAEYLTPQMKSNAPGQLLGYTLQFPRALVYLLKSGPGDTVSVEVFGDVAITTSSGEVTAEEVKSSVARNPLTDKSTDLWKTLANWMDAINNGHLVLEKTNFKLYCNQSGRLGIVDKFSSAQNVKEAQKAIDYAKEKLNDISIEHDIWEYYDSVVNQNESLLLKLVEKFELKIGSGVGYEEVSYELRCKHVHVNQVEFMMDKLSGWLQKEVVEKIAAREKAIISWERFNHQFLVLFERARSRELIDFSLQYPPGDEEVHSQVRTRPTYLQQLEVIGYSDDEILEAVYEYLRADVNRIRWIDNEIIDEDNAADFELKLKDYWKNQRNRIEITEKTLSAEERGQLLCGDCKSRQEKIRDINPPYPTIAGTYHALADEPVLGWDPNWKKRFQSKKDN